MAEYLPVLPEGSGAGRPRVPVAYGQYETGRSKNPSRKSPFTSPAFKDGMEQQVPLPVQGDPGAYNPYYYEDSGTNPQFNSNSKNRKPFDSTQVRELRASLFGVDTPSVGQYPVFLPEKTLGDLDDNVRYPKIDANVSVFRSGSLQRPSSKSDVPGPQRYSPNIKSVHPAISDSGHSMRNAKDRFHEVKYNDTCDEGVGPGTYGGGQISGGVSYVDLAGHPIAAAMLSGTVTDQTLEADSQIAINRGSRIKPGFMTTSPQRPPPLYGRAVSDYTGPGCYEPLEPRLKDLKLQGGDAWRSVM